MSALRARKRFGQHFLRDPATTDAIIRAIAPAEDDVIVEIGPGQAVLTAPLAERARTLHAIEIDRDLAADLRLHFAANPGVIVHECDALQIELSTLGTALRIVGNLPYNISTPLLFRLLDQRHLITDMHLMLQKEVADRMAAKPGGKAFGRLSVMIGCHFEVHRLFDVGPDAFEPPPAVTSAFVRLTPLPEEFYRISDPHLFSTLVTAAFSQRRKTLRNALRKLVDPDTLAKAGVDPGARAETVTIAQFTALANALAACSKGAADEQRLR